MQVFNADGSFVYGIHGSTSDGSDLQSPWGVAFDPSGNLHVANHGSGCVKIFTAEGKYVTQYGSDTLRTPAGIAIDEEGYSFVAEYYYVDKGSSRNGMLKILQPHHQYCYVLFVLC
uniref:NHL domain containing protein n=1 Tax=uncultured organism TaxID=155900 RepID=A0A1B3SNY1_9ZZZZ|nr:NHL domain containing protein [uncultured organism]